MALPKAYDPKACEDRIYALWESSGAFKADAKSTKESFTVSMPPPNATGQLHLGHAVMLALEDIFIRFNRMKGKEALWVPGTDHAAIATESVVIKNLQKEGMRDPRAQLGREKLVARIAEFVEKSRATIRGQIRKMGASCDWSRERYTMDPVLNRCVNEVFVQMYEDGLIYRGHRIVNWDPKMQTTVSDDEIEYREEKAPFYTFQYGPFQISTSRPETKFGDKYVVMHPDDDRYDKYKHGDTFVAEWINGPVTATVIKDKAIDMAFGTGVMTITPWHDPVDFEIAERHDLQKEQIIGFDGKLLSIAGEFEGLPIADARPKIVEKLKEKGLLVKTDENYVHRVAVSYRGKGVVEPQIKEQWFIDVNKPVVSWKRRKISLKQIMQETVRTKLIAIIPERFEKVYFNWVDNLRDWCVSRQIWWGHRVPVYYCSEGDAVQGEVRSDERSAMSGELKAQSSKLKAGRHAAMIVSVTPITQCPVCGGQVTQDPDTLDTWFSSGLWTWSTLVDPALADDTSLSLPDLLKSSPDFRKFHPTQVMETGYDIIFFWVARMILMTTYATGDIPFETVYLHGLIRTREGKKMSKSDPETMIDPLDIIPKYGADALRLSMIVGQSPGADARLYEEKIGGYRNFINKLWNASRFVLLQCEQAGADPQKIDNGQLIIDNCSLADRALLSALQQLIEDVTKGLDEYRLSDVGERLYSFVWDYFCDWYLELTKGEANIAVLVHTLRTILILLHPYCPFVTEELWGSVKPAGAGMLIKEPWPEAQKKLRDEEVEAQLQIVIQTVKEIRALRVAQNVEAQVKVHIIIDVDYPEVAEILRLQEAHVLRLARLSSLEVNVGIPAGPGFRHGQAAIRILNGMEIHMPLAGLVDVEKERAAMAKEKEQLEQFIAAGEAKLANQDFVARAPEKVVLAEKEKLAQLKDKLAKVGERLKTL
ncbi:MAG: valine--tRNA ligase [Candidatus Peribacteraceae bacterium]|nr:valine--tRNA ligase [Candidatus Peribacteraceae bacterium]